MARFGDVKGQQIPANEHLWDMIANQAKRKFTKYPSLAASHWIHQQYVQQGGQFVKSRDDIHKSMRRKSDKEGGMDRKRLSPEQKKHLLKAAKKD